ncbi:MAG: erythromycin esterase family protein, partial [Chitinophagales bacterium]|nr:erythromycin esterase family protein [Chitinophagales bacterium]
ENISWILEMYKPGSKIFVWAHNNHISRGDHPDNEVNIYSGISMGSHLSKKYGKNYKAFGLSTYKGEYWAQVSYSNFKMMSCPLYEAPEGSLDKTLHQISNIKNTQVLLLDLKNARDQLWFTRPIPERFANHVNIEYGYWTQFSIPYQYDGIFFIDITTSAKSYAK